MIKGWEFYDAHEEYPDLFDDNDLNIGFSNREVEHCADFTITFDGVAPRLHIFDDCWFALYNYGQEFLELLSRLDNKHISKKELKEKLLEIGFTQ